MQGKQRDANADAAFDPPTEPIPLKPAKGALARRTSMFIEHPLWTSVGAIIGVVGIVVSIIQMMGGSGYTPASLEAEIVTMGTPEEIDANRVAEGVDATSTTVTSSPVDITLKNNGDEPALITQANAEVVFQDELADCSNGERPGGTVTAQYSMPLPTSDGGSQIESGTHSTSTRFEVKPGAIDRMQLTLGPDHQTAAISVLAAHLTLTHDGAETLDIGTVLVANTRRDVAASTDSPIDPVCASNNLKVLDKLYSVQGYRAPDLKRLRSEYERATG